MHGGYITGLVQVTHAAVARAQAARRLDAWHGAPKDWEGKVAGGYGWLRVVAGGCWWLRAVTGGCVWLLVVRGGCGRLRVVAGFGLGLGKCLGGME